MIKSTKTENSLSSLSENNKYKCPYYNRIVEEFECYDMFMIANRNFIDENLVREEDRDALYKTCLKCGKHGCSKISVFPLNSEVMKMNKENFIYGRQMCACCNSAEVDFYGICDVCGWQNDLLQNKKADYKGGANEMSLNEAKKAYEEGKEIF